MSESTANIKRVVEAELAKRLMVEAQKIQNAIVDGIPVASGNLKSSFGGTPIITGNIVSIGSPLWGQYGVYPEFGTRPHFPLLAPILAWVNNVMAVSAVGVEFKDAGSGLRALPTRKGTKYRAKDERLAIARAIQWKIFRYGTKAQEFVKNGITKAGYNAWKIETEGELFYAVDLTKWTEENQQEIVDEVMRKIYS